MSKLQDLSCGIKGLDEILGGFKSPSTILIAGTAGVGKTTMALQMLSNAAKNGEKALYVSLTKETPGKLNMFLSTFEFLEDSVAIYEMNRHIAEKDPLTTLIEMDEVISAAKPNRVVIDPITPLGFGFAEQERRRFFYTFDSMVQKWNALVFLTGELVEEELHSSIISHLADGIIYLSREGMGFRTGHYMTVLKMRGVEPKHRLEYISRKFQFEITENGFTVYPRLKPSCNPLILDSRIGSGVSGLNRMLRGGIISGNSMLVSGGAGTGKTIIGLQFIHEGLTKGEPCIIVTFEERPEQLLREAKKLGWDFKPYIENSMLQFIYSNPEDLTPGEHAIRIKENVEKMGAKRLFFDGILNLEMTIPDYLRLRGYFHSLIDYLKSRNVTSIFTSESSHNDSGEPHEVSFTSIMDSILVLKHIESKNKLSRYLYIKKARGTEHDRSVREYAITERGIEVKTM